MDKLPDLYEYTIRWKYGEFEGIRIVIADDEEFTLQKMWAIILSDYRPKYNKVKKHRVIKIQKHSW